MVELDMRLPVALAKGVPDADTPGWVGLLVMDVTDPQYRTYKCVSVSDGAYTWVPFAASVGGTGSGGITVETDPTVPAWAKAATKPKYTASEVGALPASTEIPANTSDLNNDSGYITVAVATLLNYYLKTEVYAKTETYSQTEVDNLITGLTNRLNSIADSDDTTLDQLSEIVTYIKANKSLIDSITTSKVSVADIIDNLTTADSKKPLSAAQGKALKTMYDALPAWAKASTKPTYTKSEVGLGSVDNVRQYSVSNPPPYPVTSVNGKTGAVTLAAADVGALSGKTKLSLGIHTDGLIYVFVDGVPVGNGIEMTAVGDISCYLDSDNNIILKENVEGALPDGTYAAKWLMADGSTRDLGTLVKDTNVYYSVTNTLTNCTNSNSATKVVQGSSYSATITANSGYELKSVTVTMGGSPVTVSGGTIGIASVDGNILITAVAEEIQTGTTYTNLANPNDTYWKEGYRLSIGSGGTSALAGHTTTNFIPAKNDDILRVKGMILTSTLGPVSNSTKIVGYTTKDVESSKTNGIYGATSMNGGEGFANKVTVNGDVSEYKLLYDNNGTQFGFDTMKYIRIDGTLLDGYTKNDVIITINEEITD